MANVTTPVTTSPQPSGTSNSSEMPMAPPMNSARSVAMAPISAAIHIATTSGRENSSRHTSARLRPVTMPSLADMAWNSIATRLASSTTHSSW